MVIHQCKTVNELLKEYVSLYGKTTWSMSAYSSNTALIENYISPIIGNMKLSDVTERVLEKYYMQLLKTPSVHRITQKEAYLQGEKVRIKKYFYVIRPLLAAKWIVDKKTQPPMLFSELIDAELPTELKPIIDKLLEMKQNMPEMGLAPKIKLLDHFINTEMEAVKKAADEMESVNQNWTLLDDFFRRMIIGKQNIEFITKHLLDKIHRINIYVSFTPLKYRHHNTLIV